MRDLQKHFCEPPLGEERDLNPQRPESQSGTLPIELPPPC